EFCMTVGIVHARAYDLGAQFFELEQVISEAAGFLGAPRRVVLGVEVEHNPFPRIVLQSMVLPRMIGKVKSRRSLTYLGKFCSTSSAGIQQAGESACDQ